MENKSKIAWIFVGYKTEDKSEMTDEELKPYIESSFSADQKYRLVLYSKIIEGVESDLSTIEEGFVTFKNETPDYKIGMYGIVTTVNGIQLMSFPIETDEN